MAKEELIEMQGKVDEMLPYDLSKGRITFRHIENRQPCAAGAPAFKRKS